MIRLCALAALLLTTGACAHVAPEGDLYAGMTLLDPEAERRIENAYILVKNGRIADVGSGPPPPAARVHDMVGTFASPGFIDGHAHITAGPHKVETRDGAIQVTMDSDDAFTRHNARLALAFGMTTVRNPGGDPEANAQYDRMVASGAWLGPEALHAGAVIQPPPFGGKAFAYPRTEAEWAAEAARQASLGMRYLKLYANLSEDELAAGVEAAHRHGLKAIAHLDGVSWARAAALGVDGLEHALPTSPDLLEPEQRAGYLAERDRTTTTFMYRWYERADLDGPLIQGLVRALAERRIVTNMTWIVNEGAYNLDRYDQLYPAHLFRFEHPKTRAAAETNRRATMRGWTAADFARARNVMPKVLAFGRLLHEAGVPMLIGTDGYGGGPWFAHEMGLHVQAGIPAWEVLRMATSEAADILAIGHRTGRIARGYEADVVFLSADPSLEVRRADRVRAVLRDGEFFTFEELTAGTP